MMMNEIQVDVLYGALIYRLVTRYSFFNSMNLSFDFFV